MSSRGTQPWVLAIDFGTTATAGATGAGGPAELVEIDNERRMPSMVCWKERSNGTPGRLLLGDEAENEAALAPQCVERCPKRKLAQDFMLLGSERVRVTDAIGQILLHVVDEAAPRQGGQRPRELRLTHPARWGEKRLSKLREAAAFAGFDDPLLIPEPVGAAIYFAEKQLSPEDHVAVYDLGGGTFDTAVLRRTEHGFEVVGRPGGRDDLGGEDFDDLLYRFLGERFDPEQWQTLVSPDSDTMWLRAHYDFKRDVRRAKERLSRRPDAKVRTPVPGTPDLQVSVSDFESLIRDQVEVTVKELERTISAAGYSVPELSAIYLAGGSSQIPIVSRRIEAILGMKPRMLGDPKGVIALGATEANIAVRTKQPVTGNVTAHVTVPPPQEVTTTQATAIRTNEASVEPPPPPTVRAASSTSTAAATTEDVISASWMARAGSLGLLGGGLAVLGALLVIVSRFLHWATDSPSAWNLLPTRYSAILVVAGLAAIVSLIGGLVLDRRALLIIPTVVGAFIAASAFPLFYLHYRFLAGGFWLAVAGGVLITVGSLIAGRGSGAIRVRDAPTAASARRAPLPSVVAGVALLILIGSLFLHIDSTGSAWTGNVVTRYPLVMTSLAALATGAIALDVRNDRLTGVGIAAIVSGFLLGEAFPLVRFNYSGLKLGFWLMAIAALVALVASSVAAVHHPIDDKAGQT